MFFIPRVASSRLQELIHAQCSEQSLARGVSISLLLGSWLSLLRLALPMCSAAALGADKGLSLEGFVCGGSQHWLHSPTDVAGELDPTIYFLPQAGCLFTLCPHLPNSRGEGCRVNMMCAMLGLVNPEC